MDQARLKYRIVGGVVLVSVLAILVPVLNELRQPIPLGPQAIDIPPEPTDGVARKLPDGAPLEGVLPLPQDIPPPVPPPPRSKVEGEDSAPQAGAAMPLPPGVAPSVGAAAPTQKSGPTASPTPARPPVLSSPSPRAKPSPPSAATPPVKAASAPPLKPPLAVKPTVPAGTATPPPAAAVQRPAPKLPVATAPAGSAQAWVVQLGVFGNLQTAIELRERLRKAGYNAFTEQVTTPQGQALRVRIGPELDRTVSQALRDRLARETGNDGIVVPYP